MKRLVLVLGAAITLLATNASSIARADESCIIVPFSGLDMRYTLDEFADEYANNSMLTGLTPMRLLEPLIERGCSNHAQLNRVINIIYTGHMAPERQSADDTGWKIDDSRLEAATELLMLGYEEPLLGILGRLRDRAEKGDPAGMTALGYLGISQTEATEWTSERWRYQQILSRTVERFGLTEWIEGDDHPIMAIAPGLREEAAANLTRAGELGFAPAHIIRLTGTDPERFDPCQVPRSSGRWLSGQPDDDEEPGNAFLEAFSELPEREELALDFINWPRGIIDGVISPDGRMSWHPDLRLAGRLAFNYAGIRSNCAFSTEEHAFDFGVENLEEAAIGLRYAMLEQGTRPGMSEALVFAWFIDAFHEGPDRHYAAARYLQAGAYRERLEHHNENVDRFIERLTRETIREAQKIMAEHGYYTSTIDGIPGPGFRSGLRRWSHFCTTEGFGHPRKCMTGISDDADAAWILPFIDDVIAVR